MTYKDILAYADAAKSSAVRLDVAATMAAKHKAHLTALHVLVTQESTEVAPPSPKPPPPNPRPPPLRTKRSSPEWT